MAEVFFSSDHHFYHKKIIEYSERPFVDVDDMNEEMVKRWNEEVGPKDIVYHCGDLALAPKKKVEEILAALNGRIRLVRGNHDKWAKGSVKGVEWIKDYHETYVGGVKIVLMHFPIERWNKKHYGAWHLHGHCHGTSTYRGKRMDVGVDTHDYWPYHFSEIEQRMKKL